MQDRLALKTGARLVSFALGLAAVIIPPAAPARAQAPPTVSTTAAHAAPAAPAPEPPALSSDIEVSKIRFALDVSSHTPVGVSDVFDATVPQVFLWFEAAANSVPARIRHEWYCNGAKVSEGLLHIRYRKTRAWARRNVRPGSWQVKLEEADSGRLVAVGAFVVREPPRGALSRPAVKTGSP